MRVHQARTERTAARPFACPLTYYHVHMRLIILLACAAGLCAADPATTMPVLELTYGGGGPTPDPVWAAAWQTSRSEAAAWWSSRTGLPLTDTDLACTNLHLVAATAIRPGAQPRSVVAGRWQGASPALTATWKAVAGRWPERDATIADGELMLASAGLPAPAPADTRGWRMTLHLAGAAAEAESLLGAGRGDLPLLRLVRLVKLLPLQLVAGLDPAGTGSLTLNLPPLVLAKPDAAVVARLTSDAADAAVCGVVALDGAKVLALPLPWDELCREFDCTHEEAATALTGTWAAVIHDQDHVLLVIPASPVSARLTNRLEQGLVSEHWHDSVLIASAPGLIAAWKREPPAAAVGMDSGEFGVLHAVPSRLIPILTASHDDDLLDQAIYLPLPQTLVGNCSPQGPMLATELGTRGARAPDRAALGALLATTGPQHLRLGRSPEGWLRIDLEGSVLPWLLPAMGLRWFADEAENQEGCVDLRAAIAELQKSGAGALPADLLAGVPAVTDAELDAGIAAWAAVRTDPANGTSPPDLQLAETGLPVPSDFDLDQLARCRDACKRSADLPAWSAATLDLRQAQRRDQLSIAMDSACQIATRTLARAGRQTAFAGDLQGLDACDRAVALGSDPTPLIGGLVRMTVVALRDDAYLALVMRGQLPDARITAWMAEPFKLDLASAWHGERLLSAGSLAARWLELSGPQKSPQPTANQWTGDNLGLVSTQFVLAPRTSRAWTARDLTNLMPFFRDLEQGRQPVAPSIPFRSPLAGMIMPAFSMVRSSAQRNLARHDLILLGARVARLSRTGALPADAAGLAVALGEPVVVACGDATLPVLYERRGEHGFRLAIDAAGNAPAGVMPGTWRGWQKSQPRPAGAKLVFPGSCPELVWDGVVPTPETPPQF